jgi:epoxide hydrolase-like predicted phosphatase
MNPTAAPPIAVVLWDFGGVFTGSPFHNLSGYAESLGTTATELANIVLGYDLPDGDHPWHRLERGETDMGSAMEAVRSRVVSEGFDSFSLRDFFGSMGAIDGSSSREAMLDVVARVRDAGVANAIVTNNVVELGERWRPLVPDGLFDDIIDSSAVGVRKPDRVIYEIALERVGGPDPSRAVFLDDHHVNVEAARAMGMTGIDVGPNPLDAADELLNLLGLD